MDWKKIAHGAIEHIPFISKGFAFFFFDFFLMSNLIWNDKTLFILHNSYRNTNRNWKSAKKDKPEEIKENRFEKNKNKNRWVYIKFLWDF